MERYKKNTIPWPAFFLYLCSRLQLKYSVCAMPMNDRIACKDPTTSPIVIATGK